MITQTSVTMETQSRDSDRHASHATKGASISKAKRREAIASLSLSLYASLSLFLSFSLLLSLPSLYFSFRPSLPLLSLKLTVIEKESQSVSVPDRLNYT